MATTNLQQWNPTGANQETDAEYTADSQRAGGATDPSVFEAELANKAFYQWSTYLTALFQAFANKGFSTSDSNVNSLAAVCANFLTTADQRGQINNLAPSSSVVLDASKYNAWFITLNSNVTISITGMTDGQVITLVYIQDNVGSRTVTFPTTLFTASQPIASPNSVSAQSFIYTTLAGTFFRSTGPIVDEDSLSIKGSGIFGSNITLGGIITGPEAHLSTVNASVITAFNIDISTLANIQALQVPGNANVGTLQIGSAAPSGQVLTGNGTSYVPQNLPAQIPVAVRNDVTGSRSFGPTFTNTTGYPVYVSGFGVATGSSVGSLQAFINGDPDYSITQGSTLDGGALGFCFLVPNGFTYSVQANTISGGQPGIVGLGKWIETVIQ